MVVILVIVTAFAALFLSVRTAQLSTEETAIRRLRAEAAALAGIHLTLRQVARNADWQAALARVVHEGDTSFAAEPLFTISGDISGATFTVAAWPGPDTLRLRAEGVCGGVHVERWAQSPLKPAAE